MYVVTYKRSKGTSEQLSGIKSRWNWCKILGVEDKNYYWGIKLSKNYKSRVKTVIVLI